MIRMASELLERFVAAERSAVEQVQMAHMPTLGAAYEAIAKEGINKNFVIPPGLGLEVVSGFVSIAGTRLPQQIDCMLVVGNGERYGLTDYFTYPIGQVLCILEVKKALEKADLKDAMEHLASIKKAHSEHIAQSLERGAFVSANDAALRTHFSQIFGLAAPPTARDGLALGAVDWIKYFTLLQDHMSPATIVLGFEGHETEKGLRNAFVDVIESSIGTETTFGVPSLPSLVLAGAYSLVKTNGLPYICKRSDNTWIAVVSARENPARMLLEIIWTKIAHHFGLQMPWGDGLEMERLSEVLAATAHAENGAAGWKYEFFDRKERRLRERPALSWHPAALSAAATTAFTLMAAKGGVLAADDKELDGYLTRTHGVRLQAVLNELVGTGYFMREGNGVRPIHQVTFQLTGDDETSHIAHDREKFDEWCAGNRRDAAYLTLIYLE